MIAVVTRVVAVVAGLVLATVPAAAWGDTSPTLEVGPAPAGSAAPVTGVGWDPERACTLTTDVPDAVIGDGGCTVTTDGGITEEVLIPAETTPGAYLVLVCQPACDEVDGTGDRIERPLEVQPPPTPTATTTDPVPPDGDGGSTGGGEADEVTPTSGAWSDVTWWAILAGLLLAALATATLLRRRRMAAPTTAVAVLRPEQPPIVRVHGADQPARWVIGLAPRLDPGTITVEEADR